MIKIDNSWAKYQELYDSIKKSAPQKANSDYNDLLKRFSQEVYKKFMEEHWGEFWENEYNRLLDALENMPKDQVNNTDSRLTEMITFMNDRYKQFGDSFDLILDKILERRKQRHISERDDI